MGRPSRTAVRTAARRKRRFEEAVLTIGQPVETFEGMAEERRVDCVNYLECLTYATNKNWTNFSCAECSDFALSTAEVNLAAEGISASLANSKRM